MTPLPAAAALDAYFLDARGKLLELAATLDRIGRGSGAEGAAADPRVHKLRQALEAVLQRPGGRAEAVQEIFSQKYDPAWERPQPR